MILDVRSKEYWTLGDTWKSMAIGEKFKIVYDSLSPGQGDVILEEPVFLPNEVTIETIGTITDCGQKSCEYEYSISQTMNLKIKKAQCYDRGTLKKILILRKELSSRYFTISITMKGP